MKFRLPVIILLFLACLGLTSCSAIFTGLYGMKKLEKIDAPTMVKCTDKFNIPAAQSYRMDTAYFDFLFKLDALQYKEQIKNHYQPLQALYYSKEGHLQSFQVNCYAGGFPNLKWDRNEIMTTFPPGQQAPLDSILPLEKQLGFLHPLPGGEQI